MTDAIEQSFEVQVLHRLKGFSNFMKFLALVVSLVAQEGSLEYAAVPNNRMPSTSPAMV